MKNVIDKDRLHEVMKKRNIKTQQELANMMGITKNQVSVLLSPKANPFKSNFVKLCSVLDVEPFELLYKKILLQIVHIIQLNYLQELGD